MNNSLDTLDQSSYDLVSFLDSKECKDAQKRDCCKMGKKLFSQIREQILEILSFQDIPKSSNPIVHIRKTKGKLTQLLVNNTKSRLLLVLIQRLKTLQKEYKKDSKRLVSKKSLSKNEKQYKNNYFDYEITQLIEELFKGPKDIATLIQSFKKKYYQNKDKFHIVHISIFLLQISNKFNKEYISLNREHFRDLFVFIESIFDKIINYPNGQAIGNLVYSFRNLNDTIISETLLQKIASKIPNIRDFNGESIGNTMCGLKNLKNTIQGDIIIKNLQKRLNENMIRSDKDLLSIIKGYGILDMDPPVHIVLKYDHFINNKKKRILSGKEFDAVEIMRKKGIKGFSTNRYMDCYELDIFFPKLALNIEIDGKGHDRNKDEFRDEYLKTRGIEIIRIKTKSGWESEFIRLLKRYGLM